MVRYCWTNRKGVALVMALLMVVLSASILGAVIYYSVSGTDITGLQRQYQSSKEASLGGIDIMTKEIIPRAVIGQTLSTIGGSFINSGILPSGNVTLGASACFTSKINNIKSEWTGCPADTDPMNATSNPDVVLRLHSLSGNNKDFQVSMKIVDTRPGNSDTSGQPIGGQRLLTKGVVGYPGGGAGSGGGEVKHIPFLYTIAVEGSAVAGTAGERADFEVLYAY